MPGARKKNRMHYLSEISHIIEEKRNQLIAISDKIWGYAETRFEEFQSAELLCAALVDEGFTVERDAGGIETAFVGSFGSGKPVVAFLGEFDALSGLSQKAGLADKIPIINGGNGHGCGHNLLGTGALAAAIALRYYMEQHHIPGTVRYYGCPGEEGGSGKTFMAREGLFNDVDFCLTWHPGYSNEVITGTSLANYQVYYKFKGVSTHASSSPHLGRSALDAVELMNIGVNYLREHIIPEARVHYAITDAGGSSPNVVQAEASVLYLIRAPRIAQVDEIYQRVCNIARGAALMTETKVEIVFDKACSNLVPNHTLEKIAYKNFTALGVPEYDDREKALAESIRATLSEGAKDGVRDSTIKDKPLSDRLCPLEVPFLPKSMGGSTDVGDVSWITPTVQCSTACWAVGTPGHTWQVVTMGTTSIAHKAMLHAGKVMAATAVEALENPHIIAEAEAELREYLNGGAYVCPIPPSVRPSAVK
jgi:aminobenzoyl-glutamate utilization protein B